MILKTFSDIITSLLPFWEDARFWVIARPLSGFAETFSQYIAEVQPGGGSDRPETDPAAQAVIFVVEGAMTLTLDGTAHEMETGGYAYLPPGSDWTIRNTGSAPVRFHWVRKAYQALDGLDAPEAFITNERDHDPIPMPDTNNAWATTRFVEPSDLRHDMHVNIVTFQPGDPLRRNPCDGAWALCAGGGLSAESGLGRGRGR